MSDLTMRERLEARHNLATVAEEARWAAGMTVLSMFSGGPWDSDPAVISADAALAAYDAAHPEVYVEYVRRDEIACATGTL